VNFVNAAQAECYQRILPWLQDIFGDSLLICEDVPEFGIMVGSAFAQTSLHPFQDDVLVCTRAYVVRGADLSYELYDFLLRENFHVVMGGFGVSPQGDIFFQHAILGSTCDAPELESSVMAVALLADRYDDKIRGQWGGERALDQARAHRNG
jgi:hypothetical protein